MSGRTLAHLTEAAIAAVIIALFGVVVEAERAYRRMVRKVQP